MSPTGIADGMRTSVYGESPEVAGSAFVSGASYLAGEVTVNDRASVWPFACLRADGGPTEVGAETNVQEFAMLHGATVGERSSVGHHATIDYATVGDDSLVGIGSTLLEGAVVESDCLVAAEAVVLGDQTVPEGHLAYGAPAETRPLSDDQREHIAYTHERYLELAEAHGEG